MGEFNYLQQLPAIAPEIGLTILAVVVLALDLYLPESRRKGVAYVAAFGMLGLAITPFIWLPDPSIESYWGGLVRFDVLAQVFKVMVLLAGGITCLIAASTHDLGRKGEFYLIVIVSTLGASLLSASSDLIMIFVALETLSIPLYVLATFRKHDSRSIESGMKYFLFGSFASAIMLYGFSLLYGFTSQTNIYAIADYMTGPEFGLSAVPIVVALVLIFVGFGFKISAVPFHFWTPDVYEGAPTPVTAFVSVASKAASMAVLMRILIALFPAEFVINGQIMQEFWIQLVIILAVISMTVGNVLALVQKNIKRLLAYSSISQAGYTLIGIAAIQSMRLTEGMTDISQSAAAQGVAAVTFYMFMYTFTNLLAFGVVVIFTEATGSESIKDLAGLSRRNPWLALAMTIGLLSLAGIPPAAGFFGKFFLFNAAVTAGLEWLALVGVLNAIIGLYYYLTVIKVIYVDRHEDDDVPITLNVTNAWMLGATTIIVIVLGVLPQAIFNWALSSASTLFA
ncbi:MAG: NADH-quinone oxidoreductase subunit N [Anaerolineae bacterium]|nr:NADH-quinone oxidoreductase subunit N [Anaerolineae bacterium]